VPWPSRLCACASAALGNGRMGVGVDEEEGGTDGAAGHDRIAA
jgi:hypothetical protein